MATDGLEYIFYDQGNQTPIQPDEIYAIGLNAAQV